MFDSFKYAKKLQEVGFTPEQAEAQVQFMTEVLETKLATKQDISDLRNEIVQSEYRQTIKLGTIVSIAISVAVALSKLIP